LESYLSDWLEIITKMVNSNTYKLAWGRAIIESIHLEQYTQFDDEIRIHFDTLSELILKYYWNQIFFFNLKQGPSLEKSPLIYQLTEKAINSYKTTSNSNLPVWFDVAKIELEKDIQVYSKLIKSISSALKLDVSHRFMNIDQDIKSIYVLNKKEKYIYLKKEDAFILKEYGLVLTQLLNYKWAQLLEQYNRSPKIVSKVKGSQEAHIKRSNLNRFKEILLKFHENNEPIDFYTGEVLDLNDISIDHVIPWSFMFSDDLWNLVITSKKYNSSKSNRIPSQEIIKKLIERNISLVNRIESSQMRAQLENAIKYQYVDKFYMDFRG
jgi:hypothetical protein